MSASGREMESAGLGWRISGAIRPLMESSIVDEKVVDLCLKEIKLALLQTDVPLSLVRGLQINVNRDEDNCSAYDKQIAIQSIFDELCKILDPGKLPLERSESLVVKYGVTCVETQKHIVMFVGLQGSGKTRACTQFANYYKKKGFYPAIVSADTFRVSNFNHLMQSTISSTIPLYGSFMQSDPVSKSALSGVNWFKKRSKGLIIIDTSERHTHVSSLIQEMSKVYGATKPDIVIFVVDSGIGQAAFHQIQLFKQTVQVGGVIMTNMNYDRKAGEAFSAIAATKTPIMFIGRGEGLEVFEVFDIKPFVSRLLGLQEILGFKEDVIVDQDLDICTNYTLRVYHMFIHMSEKLRGNSRLGSRNLRILNSMGNEELDNCLQNLLSCSFTLRIAKATGFSVGEILLLMEDYKIMVDVFETSDCTSFPVFEYFNKIFPGLIRDLDKVRKFKHQKWRDYKDSTVEGRIWSRLMDPVDRIAQEKRAKKEMEDEAAEVAALYGKGKLFESKREEGTLCRTMNLVESMPMEKKQKREIEDDSAKLSQGEPLEARREDGEGCKSKDYKHLCQLLDFYRLMNCLSDN